MIGDIPSDFINRIPESESLQVLFKALDQQRPFGVLPVESMSCRFWPGRVAWTCSVGNEASPKEPRMTLSAVPDPEIAKTSHETGVVALVMSTEAMNEVVKIKLFDGRNRILK